MDRRKFLKYSISTAVLAPYFKLYALENQTIKKNIPKSKEMIPSIGMGTWITFNVGNLTRLRDARGLVLNEFLKYGGGIIDSSPMYGSAEEVLGYTINKLEKKEAIKKIFAASKIWTSSNDGRSQFNQSKKLWGLHRFDLFQIHNLLNFRTHYKTLEKLKKEGQIKYLGITTSHGRMHDEFENIMKNFELDFVQLTYNITHTQADEKLLKMASDQNIAVIANRPYDGGQLMDDFKSKPLPHFAKGEGINSWAEYFLKFIISHPSITCAIPATSKVAHMKENMLAGKGKSFDPKLRVELKKYIEKSS